MIGSRRQQDLGRQALPLAFILALAALLRFWNLQFRGLLYWDEAKFALEGVRMRSALLWIVHSSVGLDAGKAVGTAKPTHALLFGLAYSVLGVHDWVALGLAATCSIVSVALTYVLADRLFSRTIALIAAALLAVSEYEIIYARSALSESDATMFFLIGMLLWTRRSSGSMERRGYLHLFLAAMLFGVSFTANYRLLVFIGAVSLVDVVPLVLRRDWRRVVVRSALWTGGLLLAPLFWQIAGVLGSRHGLYLFRNELTGSSTTYWSEALYQVHGGKQSVVRFSPLPYLQWFAVRQGPLVCALVLLGLVMAPRERSRPWLIVSATVVIPYLIYVFAPFIVPRNMEAALPFTSILAAAGLVEGAALIHGARLRVATLGLVSIAALALGTWMSWRLTAAQSGFVAAAQYVEGHGDTRLLTTSEDMVFYFPGNGERCRAPGLPRRYAILKWYMAAGYRYLVLERHRSGVADYVSTHARLADSFLLTGPIDVGENLINSENTHPPNASDPPDVVLLYDLRGLRLPRSVGAPTPPHGCFRDVVA